MKKFLVAFVLLFGLVGCEYVDDRNELDDDQKGTYKEILKKQYSDMKYEITDEKYDGDNAVVTVKLTVYDLYKVQKDADKHLADNPDEQLSNESLQKIHGIYNYENESLEQ